MTVSIEIPDDLYRQAGEIANSQHLSVDDVISSAFAEQMSAWDRLKHRAAKGSREAFLRVLDKVPTSNRKNTTGFEARIGLLWVIRLLPLEHDLALLAARQHG